jgi:hypothetical protein
LSQICLSFILIQKQSTQPFASIPKSMGTEWFHLTKESKYPTLGHKIFIKLRPHPS